MRMDAPLTGFNKKKKGKSSSYSITTFEISKPRGNKYLSFDFATLNEDLGEDESDPEDERFHDKDAREMVRRLEEKYGNKKTKSGRKNRFNEDDFIDKSLGYDLEDNFIDDSEAHDELVPSTLDTEKRGFYVNKGKLDFVSIDEECSDESKEEDDDDEEEVKKHTDDKPKKRAVISLSDSDSEREEGRLVGGPPTLKRSKPSAAVGSPLVKKTEERKGGKTAEPRRMAGAPPTLKKSNWPLRPANSGDAPTGDEEDDDDDLPLKPKTVGAAPKLDEDEVPSEDEIQLVEDPPQEAPPLPVKVSMADIPNPVQLQIFQFQQLCSQHIKPGKKQVPHILIEKTIEMKELAGRLGMKKPLWGQVLEKMAEMCGCTKDLLRRKINKVVTSRSAASTSQPLQLQPVQQPTQNRRKSVRFDLPSGGAPTAAAAAAAPLPPPVAAPIPAAAPSEDDIVFVQWIQSGEKKE